MSFTRELLNNRKNMRTFEEYLEEICFKANPVVLDDDMPDFFDNWLGSQEGEDYMRHAELYGRECYLEGKTEVLHKLS